MSPPEEKEKHRRRIRSKYARELENPKFRQRVKEDKKKKAKVDVTKLSHRDLVDMIQNLDGDDS